MDKLRKSKNKALLRERQKLLQELSSLSILIRGSMFQRFSTCSRPNCVCRNGKRHGPRTYVAITLKNVQKQYYVQKEQVKVVRDSIKQHHRLLKIAERITVINLELMRKGVLDEQDN